MTTLSFTKTGKVAYGTFSLTKLNGQQIHTPVATEVMRLALFLQGAQSWDETITKKTKLKIMSLYGMTKTPMLLRSVGHLDPLQEEHTNVIMRKEAFASLNAKPTDNYNLILGTALVLIGLFAAGFILAYSSIN